MNNMKWLIVVGIVVIALSFSIGCAPEAAPTPAPSPTPEVIKPDKINLGHCGDLTGPYAAHGALLVGSTLDSVNWANENGGVDGVPFEWVQRDNGGKMELGIEAYIDFSDMEPKPVALWLWPSFIAESVKPRADEDQILLFAGSATKGLINPPGYYFSLTGMYENEFCYFVDWLADTWSKESGQTPKLAILGWDNPTGKAIATPEVLDYVESKGVEIVAMEWFGLQDLDVTTQWLRIESAGANWVYSNILGPGAVVVAKSRIGAGVQDKINLAIMHYGMDRILTMLAGDAAEGVYGVRSCRTFDDAENPGIQKLYAEWEKRNRKPEEYQESAFFPYQFVATVQDSMNRAVDKVGWDNLTGKDIMQAMENTDFDFFDGIGPITFAPGRHYLVKSMMYRVQQGKILPIENTWGTDPDLYE